MKLMLHKFFEVVEDSIMKSNYRRGGLFMFPFVVLAIVFALIANAPIPALLSIGGFGFGASIILILLGDRREKSEHNE